MNITPRPIDWILTTLAVAAFLVCLGLLAEYTALELDSARNQALTKRIEEVRP